ncbi:MAG TPA: rhamnogalacturonan acetylesterase [Povalibacter sp.]|nr:rhamnogalacturonan acetylesterase [Povalibacter sp.]
MAAVLLPTYVLAASPLHFDFGSAGNVTAETTYDDARGYGFEPARSDSGQRFSVKLPEGTYRVSIRFGDPKSDSVTTIRAETRRLMLERVVTARGKFATREFVVNVRIPALPPPPLNAPGGSAVRLKPAELTTTSWDDRLTLEFLGGRARVAALTIEPVTVPTIYLAGDSTVTDQAVEPSASWGQMLTRFFAPDVAIANHAESGETLKSFLAELRLDKILSTIRPGDWLLIQFGHNDQKAQWPQTYVEAATTYRDYLRTYIAEARRHGAIPVLVTSPERRNFDAQGHISNSHGDYPEAVRAVAREENVALIDLWSMSKTFYEALGEERAALAFADGGRDRTHHNNYGAYELARMVVAGIQAADPRLTANLARHLAADAGQFDPAHPDDPTTLHLDSTRGRSSQPLN